MKLGHPINFLVALILVLSILLNIYLLAQGKDSDIIFQFSRQRESINLPLSNSANCSFEAETDVDFKDGHISFYKSKENGSLDMSFVNLDTDHPLMRGNAGQADLLKLIDNDEIMTFSEFEPIKNGALSSYSIFKKTGIAIWTKQYNLAGQIPFGLLSIGFCD